MRIATQTPGPIEMNSDQTESREDLPLEARVPEPIEASPFHLRLSPDDNPTWWKPGWSDIQHHVGWRWVLLAPAVVCMLIFIGGWYFPGLRGLALVFGFKLGLLVVAIAFWLAGYVTQVAIRAVKEPFCIFCGYNLSGLPDHYRCPECGRSYSHAVIAEYRKDPHWFVERWKQSRIVPVPDAPFESGRVPRRNRARDGTE
jgi:hypothetical protein